MKYIPFKINGQNYKVFFVNSDDEKLYLEGQRIGKSYLLDGEIYIDKTLNDYYMKKVLIHEVTHAFLYNYGFSQVQFDKEVICDFLEYHAENIINQVEEILQKYKKYKK